ncbi:MAG: DUF2341 domain-containing protein [Myxococcota bacterium]
MPTWRIAAWVTSAAVGGGVGACATPSAFQCDADLQCDAGVCADGGYCAFVDEGCESGHRYGAHAPGGLAGMCTPSPEGTTGGDDAAVAGSSTGAHPGDDEGTGGSTSAPADDEGTGDPTPACADWWDVEWPQRRALSIDAQGFAAPIAGFPASVVLDPNIGLSAAPGIRFVGDECGVIPHELEPTAEGDSAIAWLALPTIGPMAGPLYLYYGNPDAADEQEMGAVWDEDFAAVWHLGGVSDSSAYSNNLVPTPTPTEGPMGPAALFDGEQITQAPADPSLTFFESAGFSVSAWVRVDTSFSPRTQRIVDKADSSDASVGYVLSLIWLPDEPLELEFDLGREGGEFSLRTSAAALELGQWHHVAVTYAPDAAEDPVFFIDGAIAPSVPNVPGLGPPLSDETRPLTLAGTSYAAERFFEGAMDEVRVSTVVRSPDWMLAEYRSGTGTLLSLGAEELAP